MQFVFNFVASLGVCGALHQLLQLLQIAGICCRKKVTNLSNLLHYPSAPDACSVKFCSLITKGAGAEGEVEGKGNDSTGMEANRSWGLYNQSRAWPRSLFSLQRSRRPGAWPISRAKLRTPKRWAAVTTTRTTTNYIICIKNELHVKNLNSYTPTQVSHAPLEGTCVGMFGRFHCTCPEYSLWQRREEREKFLQVLETTNSLLNLNWSAFSMISTHYLCSSLNSLSHFKFHTILLPFIEAQVFSTTYKRPFWHLSMPLTILQCCTKEFQRVQRVFALRRIACTFPTPFCLPS